MRQKVCELLRRNILTRGVGNYKKEVKLRSLKI